MDHSRPFPETYADAANLPADGSATVSKSTFYNALSGQLASLTAVKNEQVTAATCTVENLPIGSYMVLVMGGEKAHEAYLTSIRATKYDFDKAEWVVENGVVNAAAKCKTPNVEKKEDKTTAAIGDKVTFTVDSDVPTYPASAYDVAYELEDIMAEGLTFNGDLKAYGINANGKKELTQGTEFKANYTQSTADGKTKIFKLKFDNPLIKDYTQIELVYSATVNEKIKIGSNQNTNEVKFTYDHKEKSSYTVLYSFGFDLTKRADSETGELLAGAEFELSQAGKALKFKKLSDGHYAVDTDGRNEAGDGRERRDEGQNHHRWPERRHLQAERNQSAGQLQPDAGRERRYHHAERRSAGEASACQHERQGEQQVRLLVSDGCGSRGFPACRQPAAWAPRSSWWRALP